MLNLKFNSKDDELRFFLFIGDIERFFDVKIRLAMCVSDDDLPEGPRDPDFVD